MSSNEIANREDGKYERIVPEIRIAKTFGEGANADRLIPSRWKQKAHDSAPACERGHGRYQP